MSKNLFEKFCVVYDSPYSLAMALIVGEDPMFHVVLREWGLNLF